MHQPIHISSIHDSPFNSSPLPLTKENLMNFEDTMEQQKDTVTNEILTRYCHEILLNNSALRQQQQQMTSITPSYRSRCQSTPPQMQQQRDVVVASPRVLPFPYHNDSLFLPTAEQIQYHHLHSSATSSSTSRADSFSIPPDSEFLISRPHSTTTNIHNSSSNHNFTSIQQPERRSLPARLDYNNIIISKSSKQQQRFLRRSSSFGSTSTLSHHQGEDNKNNIIKKPWLKRIMKFFNKNKYNHHHRKEQQASSNEGSMNQVWYCQYSKNPSTRFEKYYHQQHQHQQQMISVS